jgi:hypothetical protein
VDQGEGETDGLVGETGGGQLHSRRTTLAQQAVWPG